MPRQFVLILTSCLLLHLAPLRGGEISCDEEICQLAASGNLPGLAAPDFTDIRPAVMRFYRSAGNSLQWTRDGEVTPQAKSLAAILRQARVKGLNPDHYDTALLEGSRLDLAITISAVRYVSDLRYGRTKSQSLDVLPIVQQLTAAHDVESILRGVEPPYPGYRRTLQALARYRDLAAGAEEVQLPAWSNKVIEPADLATFGPALATVLAREGDMTCGGALVDGLKHFQERHGLEPDGRIGASTLAQLKIPLADRVRQLEIALERWRELPHQFARPPIVVNLPEFRLRALNADLETGLEMKVVAGQAAGHQTPIFAGEINSVVFRPYWNVPMTIQRDELLPALAKDRAYLAKNHYEVVGAPAQDSVDDAAMALLRSGNASIRQQPGPGNSLGLVAFMFPNPYAVYLHSTPAPYLFARARRDFSHGCVRVERPELLANWILREQAGWTAKRIHEALAGDKTMDVYVGKPVPVLIWYSTAMVLESGEVRFFEDIYRLDGGLDASLGVDRGRQHDLPKQLRAFR